VFEDSGYSYGDSLDGMLLGEMLLEPTEIYVKDILRVIDNCEVHGLANITGGGLKNILRLKEMKYVVENPLEPQPVFRYIQKIGKITDLEMYKTFNMGMGFVIIADKNESDNIMEIVGEKGRIVGYVEEGKGVEVPSLKILYEKY
jgi:phosphoribosylformylglycinamidine cyclo-ligase